MQENIYGTKDGNRREQHVDGHYRDDNSETENSDDNEDDEKLLPMMATDGAYDNGNHSNG